jgi:protein PhnA
MRLATRAFCWSAAYPCPYGSGRMEIEVEPKDCYGNVLSAGETVMVIKDLKVKGTSVTLKQGTKIKNIRLTEVKKKLSATQIKLRVWCYGLNS